MEEGDKCQTEGRVRKGVLRQHQHNRTDCHKEEDKEGGDPSVAWKQGLKAIMAGNGDDDKKSYENILKIEGIMAKHPKNRAWEY